MINPKKIFHNKEFILASKSPRRQELLHGLDINFTIVTKDVEEKYPKELALRKVPEFLSNLKSDDFNIDLKHNQIVITSDTVVLLEEEIIGKPWNCGCEPLAIFLFPQCSNCIAKWDEGRGKS